MIHDNLILILGVIIGVIILEIYLKHLILSVKKQFQWIITKSDERPTLSIQGLKKFISHGYDSELGWVRKPNTSHSEDGEYEKTKWSINEKGARTNIDFETQNSKISCYGDSFTFCRQVNDNETWEHFISMQIGSNVQNFGVGNYGVDQSLIRMKREFSRNKTDIVILGVVPDSIRRNLNVWKHYFEYGNTFGFKPRFIINKNKLKLIKNPIDDERKFFEYEKYLEKLVKDDYFYEKKFKKEIIKFPYIISILKNPKRNLQLIYWIKKIDNFKKNGKNFKRIAWNPMKIIMRINLNWRIKLFNDYNSVILFKKIIEEYVNFSLEESFKPIFVFLPQKDDLLFIRKKYHFYKKFINELELIDKLFVIDVTEQLLKEPDIDRLYVEKNEYGGHLSKVGNQKVAELILIKLKNLNLI